MNNIGKKDILISETNEVPGKKIIKTIGNVKSICNAKKSDIKKLAKFKWKAGPIKFDNYGDRICL